MPGASPAWPWSRVIIAAKMDFLLVDLPLSWFLSLLFVFPAIFVVLSVLPKRRVAQYHERYVLITGCDSGFGKLTAIRLDQLGFHVFATCLTTEGEESLKDVCSERLNTLHLDVTSSEEIREVYQEVQSKIPRGKGQTSIQSCCYHSPCSKAD